eukprot:Clim_evm43s156 gene=Clim_evmTU43s156
MAKYTPYPEVDLVSFVNLPSQAKVSPEAKIKGPQNCKIGSRSVIFADSSLRGDLGKIAVGPNCLVGSKSVLAPAQGYDLRIGSFVQIGENCEVCANLVGNYVAIGDGAIVGGGADIGECCVIEANARIAPGQRIPHHSRVTTQGVVYGGVGPGHAQLQRNRVMVTLRGMERYGSGG